MVVCTEIDTEINFLARIRAVHLSMLKQKGLTNCFIERMNVHAGALLGFINEKGA